MPAILRCTSGSAARGTRCGDGLDSKTAPEGAAFSAAGMMALPTPADEPQPVQGEQRGERRLAGRRPFARQASLAEALFVPRRRRGSFQRLTPHHSRVRLHDVNFTDSTENHRLQKSPNGWLPAIHAVSRVSSGTCDRRDHQSKITDRKETRQSVRAHRTRRATPRPSRLGQSQPQPLPGSPPQFAPAPQHCAPVPPALQPGRHPPVW